MLFETSRLLYCISNISYSKRHLLLHASDMSTSSSVCLLSIDIRCRNIMLTFPCCDHIHMNCFVCFFSGFKGLVLHTLAMEFEILRRFNGSQNDHQIRISHMTIKHCPTHASKTPPSLQSIKQCADLYDFKCSIHLRICNTVLLHFMFSKSTALRSFLVYRHDFSMQIMESSTDCKFIQQLF